MPECITGSRRLFPRSYSPKDDPAADEYADVLYYGCRNPLLHSFSLHQTKYVISLVDRHSLSGAPVERMEGHPIGFVISVEGLVQAFVKAVHDYEAAVRANADLQVKFTTMFPNYGSIGVYALAADKATHDRRHLRQKIHRPERRRRGEVRHAASRERPRLYQRRKGWTVADAHVYVDDGISGAEFKRRPGFQRLMGALTPKPPFQRAHRQRAEVHRPRDVRDRLCDQAAGAGRRGNLRIHARPIADAEDVARQS